MNTAQKYTARGIAIGAALFAAIVVFLLVVEGHAVIAGGHSTISELMWLAWAKQPGAIFIISHVLAAPFWFLMGHFFWQSSDVYERIRKDGL